MMRFSLVLLILSFVLQPAALAGSRSDSGKVALGNVTWVAVSRQARKKLLTHAERITKSSKHRFVILKQCPNSTRCARAAKMVGAQVLLTGRVEALGNTYLFRLQGRCLDGNKTIAKRSACEVCTVSEAGQSLGKALVDLASQTQKQICRPKTAATHQPRKEAQGPSDSGSRAQKGEPTSGTKATGGHEGQAHAGQGSAQQSTAEAGTGTPKSSRARLAPRLKLSGWIVGGLSVVALVTGGVLLAFDGKGTCSDSGQCPKVYDFKASGIASLALGGVGLAAGATLVVLGYLWSDKGERLARANRARPWILTAAPLPGGVALGALGSF